MSYFKLSYKHYYVRYFTVTGMLLSCFFVCSLPFSTEAINKVGNGGDVVFCKATQKNLQKSTQLLDFYEANINFATTELNHEVIAESRLKIIATIAPKLSNQYLKRLKEITSEIEFKSDIVLTDVQDSKHLYLPQFTNCQLLQIAIRKELPGQNEKRFIISKNLWDELTPFHRAGLLTHEIIYEHLSKLGEDDSVKARKLNNYLYEDEKKRKDFWKFIKELEIAIYP